MFTNSAKLTAPTPRPYNLVVGIGAAVVGLLSLAVALVILWASAVRTGASAHMPAGLVIGLALFGFGGFFLTKVAIRLLKKPNGSHELIGSWTIRLLGIGFAAFSIFAVIRKFTGGTLELQDIEVVACGCSMAVGAFALAKKRTAKIGQQEPSSPIRKTSHPAAEVDRLARPGESSKVKAESER
jgi:hypothetical protein